MNGIDQATPMWVIAVYYLSVIWGIACIIGITLFFAITMMFEKGQRAVIEFIVLVRNWRHKPPEPPSTDE